MKFYCVTPCLNAEKYIEETMLSVITQTIFKEQGFSLIYTIRDGGSSDNTVKIIERIIEQFSGNENIQINYSSEKDSGMYDALTKGFESETIASDIYSYINAGDYYSQHAFSIVSDVFFNNPIHVITGINVLYNDKSHLINFSLPFCYNKNLFLKGLYGKILPFVQQESTFWDAEAHKKIDFNQLRGFKLAGDYYLWKTFIDVTPLYVLSAWLGGFKKHPNQLSSQIDEYFKEVKDMTLAPTIFDYLFAYIHKIMWRLPNGVKMKLSPHMFEYDIACQQYRLTMRTKYRKGVK